MFFKRKPPNIFYGWWIAGSSLIIALYIGGVIFYGFTAFFEPIVSEMGWSYTQVSLAASLRGLEMSFIAPLVGTLADRWGPRRLIAAGAVITTAGLLLISATTSLALFYAGFTLLALGLSGCTLTVLMTTVANWFHAKIGLASGIAICGFGLSGLLVPVIVKLIATYDWRTTLQILALGMLAIVLPLSLVFRHKPEQYGYLPDGDEEMVSDPDDSAQEPVVEAEMKIKQALKNGQFWRLALVFLYHMLVVNAVVTHVMPYLSSIGISRSFAGMVATAIPLMSIPGRITTGWLGDKFNKRLVAIYSFSIMGGGVFLFGLVSNTGTWILVPFLILFGTGYGGCNVLRASLGREYFGRANFGAIFGLMVGINAIGGIIGPTLAGWAYDSWGSYQTTWFLLAGLDVIALILVLTLTPVKGAVETADNT
ncbi:MFS transporter [Chloroflexota bacterium]